MKAKTATGNRVEGVQKKSEELYRTLFELAPTAILVVDAETGRHVDCNEKAVEQLRYSRESLRGLTAVDVSPPFQPEGRPTIEKAKEVNAKALKDESVAFEWTFCRPNGEERVVEVLLVRFSSLYKNLMVGWCIDITERKRAEKDLQESLTEIKRLKERLERDNILLREEIEVKFGQERIVGESQCIREVLRLAQKVAKEDTTVLIMGETGTGKELLARAIHGMSPRKERPLTMVNCAALPATLVENELFGREKGAYTGALARQIGRFEKADGSTIFLDEIGDLSLELQVKLLRVLQDGKFERLGSTETINVDTRVIAATNADLAKLVSKGKFRKDLYYRLNIFPITMPPLRERLEDIPLLVWALVKELGERMGKKITRIPEETMDSLQNYSWPGNIRELRNVVERAMILTSGSTLIVDSIQTESPANVENTTLEEVDRKHITAVLRSTGWRVSGERGAAEILGVKRSTLCSKMQKLGIKK